MSVQGTVWTCALSRRGTETPAHDSLRLRTATMKSAVRGDCLERRAGSGAIQLLPRSIALAEEEMAHREGRLSHFGHQLLGWG